MICDDCKKEVQGTHIYWKGKNRCWGCDKKFDKEFANHSEVKK